jgi:hypothetical protein
LGKSIGNRQIELFHNEKIFSIGISTYFENNYMFQVSGPEQASAFTSFQGPTP